MPFGSYLLGNPVICCGPYSPDKDAQDELARKLEAAVRTILDSDDFKNRLSAEPRRGAKHMIQIRTLLLALGFLCLASPALAGFPDWRNWTCSAFENAKRCNAEYHPHSHRCGCIVR
jgi:hypothetical protein